MEKNRTHIAFVIHNAVSVPYFNWFAEKAMKSDEWKFSFIFLNENNEPVVKDMQPFGCDVYGIHFNSQNRKKSLFKAIFQLRKLFKKIKPDIVHSHLFYDGVAAMTAARWAGIKIRVQTKQSTGFNWYYAPSAVKFDKWKNKCATHLIAVSSECRDFIIEKEKSPAKKIHLVNHGIKFGQLTKAGANDIEDLKRRFELNGKKVISTVARYIDWKGYKYLIEAAAELVKKYPDLIFLAVGEGPQRKELESLIEKYELQENFILTGFIQRDQIPALYQLSDIYVHAALREPFGFVIAEAMINGLPIVSTNTGAARDGIEHKKSGYLIPYENVEKIIEGIECMLSMDENTKSELKKNTMNRAIEKFDFENMWKGYTDIYRAAIKRMK